ncbi:MAG: SGNH/GDSL hydrolase family protein [Aggregatilineales bacterium]
MTDLLPLSPESAFQIDFNFQQVPSALAVDIPVEAAAAMLHISPAQFTAYIDSAFAECTRSAKTLLEQPGVKEAIQKLKAPRTGTTSTIMTVGDSITTYRYGYAEILRALLTQVEPEQKAQFYNHGRSGYTSTHGLEHTFTQYLAQKPDWVFLKYGANDTKRFGGAQGKLLVSTDEYTANMTQIVDAFLRIGARIVVLTPTPIVELIVNTSAEFQAMSMAWDNADLQACAAALRAITYAHGLPLVDLVTAFTVNPDPALYLPDGLHPGPAGQRVIIEKALETINSYS